MKRLTCSNCKNTLGAFSNTCSNPSCKMQNKKQKGILLEYNITASEMGKKGGRISARRRLKGLTKDEISSQMSNIRYMKIPLHRLLEEKLGISKIKSKEELEKLLKDEKKLQEVVDAINNVK